MRPTILLFDIDGTLITTGGVGRRALELAFERRYGRRDACSFRLDGMTDRLIVRLGLEAAGVEATDGAIEELIAVYLEVLKSELERVESASYRLHPGMLEALEAARRARCAVGLGTGNVRRGAELKLERVGVFHYFEFGGFGCDAEDRAELVRMGAERGARKLGAPLAECRVVVIGDTPKDVAAARALGAESLGVGTGSFSSEALLASGATYAFDDLARPEALAALLG